VDLAARYAAERLATQLRDAQSGFWLPALREEDID